MQLDQQLRIGEGCAESLRDDIGQLGLADAAHPAHTADSGCFVAGFGERPHQLVDLSLAAHEVADRRAELVEGWYGSGQDNLLADDIAPGNITTAAGNVVATTSVDSRLLAEVLHDRATGLADGALHRDGIT